MRSDVFTMVDHNELGMSRVPILVILGATGSGKSRLGIELARRFSGEIISADSMQVYRGLDIITAKVTKEERNMAPHHMLDVVDPLANFTVVEFRDMVLPIMDDVLARKKIPIIVGGTNYYIESILWQILIKDANESILEEEESHSDSGNDRQADYPKIEDSDRSAQEERHEPSPAKKFRFKSREDVDLTNEELHRKLGEVDPEMATRLHPNNRRKVIRSLEVFQQHGVTHSELLKAQRMAGGSGLGGPLRHPNSIILWLRCDTKVLGERLDSRVDAMLETGLVQELLDFHRRYNEDRIKSNQSADYTKGIFQSIGFKEFHAYLVLSEEEKRSEKGQKLLKQGIEDLKTVTKRYAKKQGRWVTNRLIRRADRQVPPVYALDCTNVEEWNERVLDPAIAIVSSVLNGEKPAHRPLNEDIIDAKVTDSSNDITHFCEICERIFVGELQWNAHINGRKHERVITRKKRLAEKERQEKQEDEPCKEKEKETSQAVGQK